MKRVGAVFTSILAVASLVLAAAAVRPSQAVPALREWVALIGWRIPAIAAVVLALLTLYLLCTGRRKPMSGDNASVDKNGIKRIRAPLANGPVGFYMDDSCSNNTFGNIETYGYEQGVIVGGKNNRFGRVVSVAPEREANKDK